MNLNNKKINLIITKIMIMIGIFINKKNISSNKCDKHSSNNLLYYSNWVIFLILDYITEIIRICLAV